MQHYNEVGPEDLESIQKEGVEDIQEMSAHGKVSSEEYSTKAFGSGIKKFISTNKIEIINESSKPVTVMISSDAWLKTLNQLKVGGKGGASSAELSLAFQLGEKSIKRNPITLDPKEKQALRVFSKNDELWIMWRDGDHFNVTEMRLIRAGKGYRIVEKDISKTTIKEVTFKTQNL